MLQGDQSALLMTFIKLPLLLRSLFCLFLSGRFTQVLLTNWESFVTDMVAHYGDPLLSTRNVTLDIVLQNISKVIQTLINSVQNRLRYILLIRYS